MANTPRAKKMGDFLQAADDRLYRARVLISTVGNACKGHAELSNDPGDLDNTAAVAEIAADEIRAIEDMLSGVRQKGASGDASREPSIVDNLEPLLP